MTSATKLDQRVTFQQEATTSDGQGGLTSSGWANIGTRPTMSAHVKLAHGIEGDQGDTRQANRYVIELTIRNRDDLSETMAVLWRGNRYNIRSIVPYNSRRGYLFIRAESGVPL